MLCHLKRKNITLSLILTFLIILSIDTCITNAGTFWKSINLNEKPTFSQVTEGKIPHKNKVFHQKNKRLLLIFVPTEKKFDKKETEANSTFIFSFSRKKLNYDWLSTNIRIKECCSKTIYLNYSLHSRSPPVF